MQALYKLPIDGVYDYETEGIQYFYATCTEDAIKTFVADGWVTDFSQLKGGNDGLQGQNEEELRQKADEEVKKRGRKPKAANVLD